MVSVEGNPFNKPSDTDPDIKNQRRGGDLPMLGLLHSLGSTNFIKVRGPTLDGLDDQFGR